MVARHQRRHSLLPALQRHRHCPISINASFIMANNNAATPPYRRTLTSSSTASSSGSKRQIVASRALGLSSKVLSGASQFLADNKYDGLASKLARADQKVREVQEERDWGQLDHGMANRRMQVGGSRPVTAALSGGEDGEVIQDRQVQKRPGQASGGGGGGASSYLSYFGKDSREKRARETYPEEHIVCFPGFAALQAPNHARAGDIDVFISGYCYRTRPGDAALTRSQRLLLGLCRKWTGLPALSAADNAEMGDASEAVKDGEVEEALRETHLFMDLDPTSPVDAQLSPEETKERTFAALLEMGEAELDEPQNIGQSTSKFEYSRDNSMASEREANDVKKKTEIIPERRLTEEPEPISDAAEGHELQARLKALNTSPPKSDSTSSSRYSAIKKLASRPTSRSASPTRLIIPSRNQIAPRLDTSVATATMPSSHTLTRRGSFDGLDLVELHGNMKARLQGFFGQKIEGRRVRIELYPIEQVEPDQEERHETLSPAAAQLLKVSTRTTERPLYTKLTTTTAGGGWSDKLTLPWQVVEAYIKTRGGKLDSSPTIGLMRLRVKVELVKEIGIRTAVEVVKSVVEGSISQQNDPAQEQRERLDYEWRNTTRDVEVTPALGDAVHLISDIDDTIKKTEVLDGLRSIFRNVFLWSYEEVVVEGMASWYRNMMQQGCVVHYVSNSPWELWGPIERYLEIAQFPPGSVSLKEYSSMVTSMFSSAGSKKRARIEAIMKEFSNSKIICVGDSSEQDLEVYASLAIQYPGRILAIYIRNVTTLPSERRPLTPRQSVEMLSKSKSSSPAASMSSAGSGSIPASKDFARRSNGLPPPIPAKPTFPNTTRSNTSNSMSRPDERNLSSTFASTGTQPPSLTLMEDPSTDSLSPNNPTSTPQPNDDARTKAIDLFWGRVRKAEREVPKGTIVKLFRTGIECEEEALRLAKLAMSDKS